ncbi:indole-3-glycerol phosphate synthase TrpC [Algihabitans albus]|uniref:indole-3-glycerol phosphate synthase TrpC n=1 Tax=Algihabitans albus TaxID=2164067 RepID=UPI000E5D37FB|nr:indole-3-glycerol phosphate synthase TrpC [Algihabitans albus]
MSDVLARICADKLAHIERCKTVRPLSAQEAAAAAQAEPPRGFLAALLAKAAGNVPALICEIKKASPSKGLIRPDFEPAILAEAYLAGGAACLSVLTDGPYFQGDDADLLAARTAVPLPVLRKDFMLDPYQVFEARALGADCILLIMAALGDDQAAELEATATALGMDVLVEVHDAEELRRALRLASPLIGINNRNLKTLDVSLETFALLAAEVPDERFLVAESGIHTAQDLRWLARRGAKAFLIGESLMRQMDVAAATRALLAPADAPA